MGYLRFIFSFLVLISHLAGVAYAKPLGYYSVQGFFVLSGFVITSALNEVYEFDGLRFWTNRLLRVLPMYYAACIATCLLIVFDGSAAGHFLVHWQGPFRLDDVSLNALVLPQSLGLPGVWLLPQFWSVAVELIMYAFLSAVVARGPASAAAGLAVGICFHVMTSIEGLSWHARYFAAPSALLPFSLGALIYFLRRQADFSWSWSTGALASLAWFANLAAAATFTDVSEAFGANYYLGIILVAVAVASFANTSWQPAVGTIDRFLGELAYPLFLVQWLAGFVVVSTLALEQTRGWDVALLSAAVAMPMAAVLAILNKALIDPIRNRVRSGEYLSNSASLKTRSVG